MKLEVIKAFIPVARHDGSNLIKQVDQWINKSGSNPFKELGMNNLKNVLPKWDEGRFVRL